MGEAILRINRNALTKDVESVELYVAYPIYGDEGCIGVEWNLRNVYDTVEEAVASAKALGVKIVETEYTDNLLNSVLKS